MLITSGALAAIVDIAEGLEVDTEWMRGSSPHMTTEEIHAHHQCR
jgi:hypothetical protein